MPDQTHIFFFACFEVCQIHKIFAALLKVYQPSVPALYFFGYLLVCVRWRGVSADVKNCISIFNCFKKKMSTVLKVFWVVLEWFKLFSTKRRKSVTEYVVAFNQNFVDKKRSASKTLCNWIWENEKVGDLLQKHTKLQVFKESERLASKLSKVSKGLISSTQINRKFRDGQQTQTKPVYRKI